MAYHESEEERKSAQTEDLKMRNAQRYAKMLTRLGENEDELAIYIEYAWTEAPACMADDIKTMERYVTISQRINAKINDWGWKRFGKRFWV
jgi:hypothetical protein